MSKPKSIMCFGDKLDLFFSPIILFFHKFGIRANHITLLQILPATISFLYLVHKSYLLAAIFLAGALLLDVLDGSWARITKDITKNGRILDKVLDLFGIYIFLLAVLVVEYNLIFIALGLGVVNIILYVTNEFYAPELYCGVRTFGLLGLVISNLKITLTMSLILGLILLIIKISRFYLRKNRQVV